MVNKCPECGSTQFYKDPDKGEVTCAKCGTVIDESMVDTGQDWRAFDSEQQAKRARTGTPLTHKRHDKGLSTEIGKGGTELFKVPAKKRSQFFRIRKWQKRLLTSKDRNLSFALSELQRLVSYLGLPKTLHEEVAKLYERALQQGLVRGRSIESIIASLVYSLTREYGTPRTLTEISQASGIGKRELGRTYRYLSRKLGLRILPAKPEDYIPRFASMLGLSDKTEVRAVKVLKKAKNKDVISGKGPTGCAAAAIYIASVLEGERKTQRQVGDVVGVTEVTIRNRYKEMADALGIEEEVEEKAKEDEERRKEEEKKKAKTKKAKSKKTRKTKKDKKKFREFLKDIQNLKGIGPKTIKDINKKFDTKKELEKALKNDEADLRKNVEKKLKRKLKR